MPPSSPVTSEAYVPYVKPVPPKPAKSVATVPGGRETNHNSLLEFYRQLIQVRHSQSALRDGEQIVLNHDDQNALVWIRKPRSVTLLTPAVVIVCNLSEQPLVLPLKAELARLHLRGSFLKTILRSDDGMGSMHLDPVVVPPLGVYVGELHY